MFAAVGVSIPSQFGGDQPIVIADQPALTLASKTPTMMYLGAEYCPYCAAERWGMAVALARFGRWSGLDTTASGLIDGDVSTLSFRNAKLTSPYLNFVPIEICTNVVDPNATGCSGYKPLQSPSKAEQHVIDKYAAPPFVPGDARGVNFPFMDVDNKALFSGSTYEPTILTGLSQAEIAGGLTDPTNPVTQSIVTTANYITAAVCAGSGGKPTSVCGGTGVRKATTALGIGSTNG